MTGRRYSIGVGLTSACPFTCPHCYSGAGRNPVHLDSARLFRFIDKMPPAAINLGTGESCMHPEFLQVVDAILQRGIPLALTTAGPSLLAMSDGMLSRLHDVDLSLDYPNEGLHDATRATGAFRMVEDGIIRCRELGVTASLAMCLMKGNAGCMRDMCRFAREARLPLRVNVYKPVFDAGLKPSYDDFWSAVSVLFEETSVLACSEPIVNAALAFHGRPVSTLGSPCGLHGFRVSPHGEVLPCVYWGQTGLSIEQVGTNPDLLSSCGDMCHAVAMPGECGACPWKDYCLGGCAGRRYYTGLSSPDEYCFHLRGISPPLLKTTEGCADQFIHAGYLCTLIGMPAE